MKKEVRKCAVHGKKFTPKSANAAYCSEKCYKIAKAKKDKASKDAINGSLKDAKKIADKPVVKKQAKKVVKAVCKEKIHVNKPKHIVGVNRGDGIRFIGFTPDQIFQTAIDIAILACRQRFNAALAANAKPSKKGK